MGTQLRRYRIQFLLSFSFSVSFIFEISPRNKVQPPTDTQSPHSGRKSTMSTASFLTFATLLILMTLSWSQPGEAALRTSDHGDPERPLDLSRGIRTQMLLPVQKSGHILVAKEDAENAKRDALDNYKTSMEKVAMQPRNAKAD